MANFQDHCVVIIILGMAVKMVLHDVIGEPITVCEVKNISTSSQGDCGVSVRHQSVMPVDDCLGEASTLAVDNIEGDGSILKCSFCIEDNCEGQSTVNL